MKRLFYTLAIFFAALMFSLAAAAQTSGKDSTQSIEIKVGNLTCNGDMPTIKKKLLNQEGIDEVSFTPRANGVSSFTILYQAGITNKKAIEKLIESTPGCDDKSTTPYRVKKGK